MIVAYFMFKETLNKTKVIAIVLLVTSVVLVTLFQPDTTSDNNDPVVVQQDTSITKYIPISSDDMIYNQVLMIAGGLVASVCFGSQLLVFKYVMRFTKDTFSIGFGFLFSCGVLGLVSLVINLLSSP
jgi:drug/metabolite transporter (DMT)-like permease